jgi:hypothetical protein
MNLLTINPLLYSIIGGSIVAFVNFLLRKRERQYFEEVEYKRKSYSDLLDNVRGFLDDPNVPDGKKKNMKWKFLKRYYNEIWIYASPTVIKRMNEFFSTVTITRANPDEKTKALGKTILAIRRSLGSKNSNLIFFNKLTTKDYILFSISTK